MPNKSQQGMVKGGGARGSSVFNIPLELSKSKAYNFFFPYFANSNFINEKSSDLLKSGRGMHADTHKHVHARTTR